MPIEIPEHLRYRAPQPRSTVGEVRSRYQEPKQYIDADLYYGAMKPQRFRDRSPPSHNFSNVTSRFREPKLELSDPANERPLVSKKSSIHMTEEYRRHKQHARSCGVGNVESHWHEQPNMEHVITPRHFVEHKQAVARSQQIKEGAAFRSCVKAPQTSFAHILASREMDGQRAVSPPRKGTHSVVMNWVNNGVPIPGQEDILTPTSPRRTASQNKPVFVTGNHARPKVPQKYAAVKEEKTVQQLCENLVTARTRSPPRVAYLPPRYQAPPSPERQRPLSPTRPRSTANNVMSKSTFGFGRSTTSQQSPLSGNATNGIASGNSSRRNSLGGSQVQRTASNVSANNRQSVYGGTSTVSMPRTVEATVRSASPVKQGMPGKFVIGGGVPTLTAATLRRSTSPTRQQYSYQESSHAHYVDPQAESEFLPFSTAPPPQLRGRV